MVERILVGTEGSQVAQNAVTAALSIARDTHAQLRAVHAIETPSTSALPASYQAQMAKQREREGQQVLERVSEEAAKLDVPTTTASREAEPDELVLEEAQTWKADLIAIGAQGRSGLSRAIRGSVADELIRSSPIPVLTVHQPPPGDALDTIDRLVVPSDGSPAALSAAPFAIELARAAGARIDLLYAVPPELEGGKYLDRPTTEIDEVHERLADEALDPLEGRCREAGVPCERFVLHDAPHRAIVEHSDASDADLVVMATQGHGKLERILLGSVTDKVLRTSNIPVVTVPPTSEKAPVGG